MKTYLSLLNSIFKIFLVVSSVSLSTKSYSQKIYTPETLPTTIKKAIRPSAILEESQLKNELKGSTHGHVIINVQLETLQDFYIYESSILVRALTQNSPTAPSWDLQIVDYPEKHSFLDPVTKTMKTGFRGQSSFKIKVHLKEELPEPLNPSYKIPLQIRFQACSTSECLLPAWIQLEIPTSPNIVEAISNNSVMEKILSAFQQAIPEQGAFSIYVLLLLFAAGLLTAFTPCVYPIYPITIGLFGRWEKSLHFPAFYLAIFYCIGMTLSYASLGIVTLLSGNLFASITQTPFFLIGMGALIVISAISFSGIIPFPVPAFLQNYMSHVGEGAEKKGGVMSLLAAAGMGASLGIIASPCVGPVLVALLAWLSKAIASGEANAAQGFLLLAFFGSGMSFPFLVLGHLILRTKTKVQLGRFTPWVKYLGTILLLISSLFFFVPGFKQLNSTPAAKHSLPFTTFDFEAAPQSTWKVIDFRADWCAACIQLERETFSSPKVAEQFTQNHWTYVQVDVTQIDERLQKLADQFGVLSLPSVLLVNPEGAICKSLSLHEFEEPTSFLNRLEKAKTNCI